MALGMNLNRPGPLRTSRTEPRINIDLDCTPEKAREFFDLRKIEPVQPTGMARVERQTLDAAVAISPLPS